MDADAQAVVVLILDGVEGSRLGRAAQSGIGYDRPVRCRLQPRVDHIEAHVEPRCEVVLGPGADRPEGPVVAALAGGDLGRREGDRAANGARSGKGARAKVGRALRIADRPIGLVAVVDLEVRPVDRRPEVRLPQVVVGRVDAPDGRQLDIVLPP